MAHRDVQARELRELGTGRNAWRVNATTADLSRGLGEQGLAGRGEPAPGDLAVGRLSLDQDGPPIDSFIKARPGKPTSHRCLATGSSFWGLDGAPCPLTR